MSEAHPKPRERDERYELAPRPLRPKAGKLHPSAAPPVLGYRAATPPARRRAEPDDIKRLYLPLWLIVIGITVEVLTSLSPFHRSVNFAMLGAVMRLTIGAVVMLPGILLAVKFRGISLGGLWTALLRLAAISVTTTAATTLLTPMFAALPFGLLFMVAAVLVVQFTLLGMLFDLDEGDTWFCICMIFLIQVGLYFLLPWLGLAV